ncbi:AAA family ATPase [Hyalangium rubrum]|uniref:histidine kinase n=1 Tax=Hyalangium rubrum TaxID=3103134 RepID=A0ABU5H1R8_9BACT|nr:AAA family ATPase [Hyalangium sp. s54d21]MDY7226060.1 AAA family ATPase [Hyalangium sp. s54d21]
MIELPTYTRLSPLQARGYHLLYRAVRVEDGLTVILKTPRSEHPGPRDHARLEYEYQLLQRLEGAPGVIRVHGLEIHQDRPVLVLEDIEGTDLVEQAGVPLGPARFLELALSLASTLAEVHRRGITHKDIKPANILLSPAGPRLIDFGIATLQPVEHVQAAPLHLIEGTPAYMSPEQSGRMNRALDYRTDFYSLGVTFYQLLTGGLPFQGRDPLEWMHAHLAQAPVPPHQREPSIPPMLSAIVLKLMAKVPEERYQSAEGLKADLEKCCERLARGGQESFTPGSHDFPARFQLPQRLYGRETEVKLLLNAFERVAREGRPEWLLVRGYSGIGKSSVVNELHRPVVQRRGFFLSGKFDQLQRDVPYATLAQAFRGLVQQLLAGGDAQVESWRKRLLEAFEGNGKVLLDVVPELEWVTGPQPVVSELPPQEAQNRFHRLFLRFLGALSTPGRPLVLFLDDLQWADFASLELLKYLSTHPDTPPLLWVGAYRDNEVGPAHPLGVALEEARKAGARLGDIHLQPLGLDQTRQLVGDALPGTRPEVLKGMSTVLQEKTAGNPFFLLQLLRTLHQDGLLVRAPEEGWSWDEAGVKARAYSDNVVEFMAGRLQLLPGPTQQLLRLAAGVGNVFSVPTLALLAGVEALEVERGLELAMGEDLVVRTGSEHYRFLHDRIQQAAYALIPEAERKALHLRIGRLLLASLPPDELRERLFDVVAQLNAGVELMEEGAERHRLAWLNAEAGWRAKASAAWRSAVGYFTAAFPLLPGAPWETEYALAFKLRLDQASCELMSGNTVEARRVVDELLPRARTRPDMAEVYRLKNTLHLAAGEVHLALGCLLECLEKFGMPLPPSPTPEEVRAADEEVWKLLGGRSIESLIELPAMTDPDMKAAVSVLADLTVPALYAASSLLPYHLCRLVALAIRHGNTEVTPHAFAWYGYVCCVAMAEKYQAGHSFGRLAKRLVERPEYSAHRSGALFILAHLSRWVRPLPKSLGLFHDAFGHALQRGDFRTACYCCDNIVINMVLMGRELGEVYQESLARLEFARKANYEDICYFIIIYQRLVQQHRGLTSSLESLNGDGFDEAETEARLVVRGVPLMACVYYNLKMRARFMAGAYAEALEVARVAEQYVGAMGGLSVQFDYYLYRALILAACWRDAAPEQQREFLESMRALHQKLASWGRLCPENFRPAERMVAAELARLQGKTDEATQAYEEAMQSAYEQRLIHHAALAAELAARFWKERGMTRIAITYAREAWVAYRQWGAEGKARQLASQWPQVAVYQSGGDSTSSSGSEQLDALSLVKAQQAVSSEIVLDRLVDTLMRVALQSAGAQRGALLLKQGEALEVVTISDTTGVKLPRRQESLPWTLLSYVRRTGEFVLLGDTTQPHTFAVDAELLRGRARSVLCLPLRRKEEFYGVLYLENALTTQAFSPGRVSLLGHIASQAAISIENARLYAERQAAELALRAANQELVENEERFRTLIDRSPDAIFIHREGTLTFINPAGVAMLGYERAEELRGHRVAALVLSGDESALTETSEAAGATEVRWSHRTGRQVLGEVVSFPLVFDGKPVVVSIARDITERKSVQERLRAADRMASLGTLAASVAHEINNPLSFMTSNLRFIDEELRGMAESGEALAGERGQEVRAALQETLTGSSRVSEIVRDLKTFSRGDEERRGPVNVHAVLELCVNMARSEIRHRARLVKEFAELPPVLANETRLGQVFLNLLVNAAQAIPEGADVKAHEVRVSTTRDAAGWVVVAVKDTGVGIPPENLGRLFDPFFTTKPAGVGTGLGLSIVHGIITGMGGKITVESEPGRGSLFQVFLPPVGGETPA